MKKTILDKLTVYLFRRFQYTKIMAVNTCQPKNFIIGNITKRLMRFGNHKMITDSVDRFNVKKGDIILEVGSGNGQSICELLKSGPQKVYAIEISKSSLSELRLNFKDQRIEILERDAKNLKDHI